jgi:hypothetical protein
VSAAPRHRRIGVTWGIGEAELRERGGWLVRTPGELLAAAAPDPIRAT